MKTTLLLLILFLTGLGLRAQTPADAPIASTVPAFVTAPPDANTPADGSGGSNEVAGFTCDFEGVDMNQILEVYSHKLVHRTLLHAGAIPGTFTLKTESPLTTSEAIQAFQAVFAMNGIVVVPFGDKFLKVVPSADALTVGQSFDSTDATNLPDMGSVVTHIVQLKYVKPTSMQTAIQPFAKLNSIIPIDDNGILIIRDYAENVKRMLEMIDRVDIDVPAVYVSEVIPIKYALATDIASALNSLGGQGGGNTVSIGSSSGSTGGGNTLRPIGTTTGNPGGTPGYGGTTGGQPRPINALGAQPGGMANPPGVAAGAAGSFQSRLQAIIQRASGAAGTDQIQVFGQAKIIADTRSNSLLIFATRADMDAITNVIAKLDVLLSQVLIESVIMEVSLGKQWNLGVSAVQRPNAISSPSFKGTGGFNNGQSFFSFVTNGLIANGTNSALQSGLSYFGQIGNSDYDVAVQAAESDDTISIIQKPRIQTFQAQTASFFVGNTVPYVTSTYNGGTTGIGSSYSQLSVGVSLDVTPFINPDGLVVMQIAEQIDDISGYTQIDGNPVPNTASKHLTSNVAVKDRDSIILGGAIYSSKDFNKSGVPLLQDIPLLGALFSSRSSNKTRNELLVLMRPTVLKDPEAASVQAKVEESRLPGIHRLESDDNTAEAKQVAAENKLQQIQDDKDAKAAAKANAKAMKSGKTNAVPIVVTPDTTSTPSPAAPSTSAPTTSATPGVPTTSVSKSVPAASAPKTTVPPSAMPYNPAAGLY
jgi:general secretion pathway protein D